MYEEFFKPDLDISWWMDILDNIVVKTKATKADDVRGPFVFIVTVKARR